jgi:hypothetical protein
MKIAVCFVTRSAESKAHKIAQLMQLDEPGDEVVVYNHPVSHAYPMPKPLETWGCDMSVFVTNERREYHYGG